MVTAYTPHKGDIVFIDFNPQAGKEQSGRRPALIMSPFEYNSKVGLALCCPITSKTKGYPFEVPVLSKKITGVILADHIRNLDWKSRNAQFITQADEVTMRMVQEILKEIINAQD